jgi:predicted Co/Zn/Cd cation transporter (cation efflux family)
MRQCPSGSYLGFTTAGLIGALALLVVGGHNLGYIGAAFTLVALVIAELATLKINALKRKLHNKELAAA